MADGTDVRGNRKPRTKGSPGAGDAAAVALGCGFLLALAFGVAWIFIPAFRGLIRGYPRLTGAIALLVVLGISYKTWREWTSQWSPQRRTLLTTILALTPAVLVYSLEEVGIRLLFLLIVCLFPGLLFYLFVSARRYSLLNEHLTNLHQLGLLTPRHGEVPEDTARRLHSYLQEFQAIYGALPESWVDRFLHRGARAFSQEQDPESGEMAGFASIISTETILPVILTTTLVVVGWFWTLPPWHIEETLTSWERFGRHEELIQEPAEGAGGEGAGTEAAAPVEAEPAPPVEAEGAGEAEQEPPPTPPESQVPQPAESEDPSASLLSTGESLWVLALAGLEDGEAEKDGPDQPGTRRPVWYKPWTWDVLSADEAADDDEGEPPAPTASERYRMYRAALLPVMTPMTFAFLGAYFFSLQLLFRRFVRRDLGASAYVSFSVRIVLAWVGTWVAVHAFGGFDPNNPEAGLLLVGFTVGVFPSVVWHILQVSTRAILGKMFDVFRVELPISRLDGLNIWHQTRLEEEDIENIPSMANANIVELLLRTRIPANRIIDWVDQAILYTHLGPETRNGEDAEHRPSVALRRHGILNATSLLRTYRQAEAKGDVDKLEAILPGSTGRSRVRSLVEAVEINPNLDLIQNWRQAGRPADPEAA